MKPLLSTLLIFGSIFSSVAQPITDTVKQLYHFNEWTSIMETDTKDRWLRYAANEHFQVFNRWTKPLPHQQQLTAVSSFYGNAVLTWLNGQPELELAVAGITKANADSFLYHVVVNDSIEIVPWQHPSVFKTNSKGTYVYIGKFESLHKLIKFEIYYSGKYYDKKTIYYNNLYTPAPVIANARLLYQDPNLFNPHKQHFIPRHKTMAIGGHEWEPSSQKRKEIQYRSFDWSDSISHINVYIKPVLLNEMYRVYLRHHSDTHSDTSFISNNWNLSNYSKNPELMINAAYFKRPGNYEIIIAAEVPEDFNQKAIHTQTSLFFSVKPSSLVQFSPKQAILYTGFLMLIGGTGFFYYRGRNKRLFARQAQEKEMATLQLRAVRSQLNPHFMFNALSGIQNLMHKQDSTKASDYLSRFARITRQVLKEADQDMNSLEDEIKLLDDYLLMEQLRFGFQYSIQTAAGIDLLHTDIPSMLLQPLVENAVKHGVSGLAEKGYIEISIQQESGKLVLLVQDNGKGFSLPEKNAGLGLRLIRERIALHNKLYPDTTILFDTLSADGYCVCKLELNHWL